MARINPELGPGEQAVSAEPDTCEVALEKGADFMVRPSVHCASLPAACHVIRRAVGACSDVSHDCGGGACHATGCGT